MQNISLNVKPLSAKGITLLVFGIALIAIPALTQSIINLSLIALNIKLSLPTTIALLQNMTWLNLIPKIVGLSVVSALIIRSHLKVDSTKTKRQITKVSIIGLTALMFVGALIIETPVASAQATALTGYILDTPLPIADWYIGTYGTGNYFAINGSNWDNLMRGVGSTAWAAYATNYTKVEELVLASVTSGSVYLKDVPFDLALMGNIPENVQVECNYQGVTYKYINSASSLGSPYTISAGQGPNAGYYLAQDSGDRICFTSTDLYIPFNGSLSNLEANGGGVVYFLYGDYDFTVSHGDIVIPSNIDVRGAGKYQTVITHSETTVGFFTMRSNSSIQDLTLKVSGSAGNILVVDAENVEVKNCLIQGPGYVTGYKANVMIVGNSNNTLLSENEVTQGDHNGIYVGGGSGGVCRNTTIINNYIHDNFDDAIDLNEFDGAWVENNRIENNEYSACNSNYAEAHPVQANGNLTFIGNKVVGGKFMGIISNADVGGGQHFNYKNNVILGMSNPSTGDYKWDNCSDVTFSGNTYEVRAQFTIVNSRGIQISSNKLLNYYYADIVFTITNTTGFTISSNYLNSWNPTTARTDLNYPFVITGTSNDYSVTNNFLENYASPKSVFAGSRIAINDNTINRRGSFLYKDTFMDYDGTMTGVANTWFTYNSQSGTIANIATSSAGVVSGSFNYTTRYPTGITPVVTVSLYSVGTGVVIDTLQLTAVNATGAAYSFNVVTEQAATTCSIKYQVSLTLNTK